MKDTNETPEKGVKTAEEILAEVQGIDYDITHNVDYLLYKSHALKAMEIYAFKSNTLTEETKHIDLDKHHYGIDAISTESVPVVQPANNDYAVKESQWISVEDRLPENRSFVLVYSDHHVVYQTTCVYKHGCFIDGLEMIYKVTHWMPLPSPPTIKPIKL